MAIYHRHNTYCKGSGASGYEGRPPKKYGVSWDFGAEEALTRLDDAVGLTTTKSADLGGYKTVTSSFDTIWPWCGMQRMEMRANGAIMSAFADIADTTAYTTAALDFDDTSTGSLRVMVRIPKFYYKVEVTQYSSYKLWISAYPLEGFKVHPAFQRGIFNRADIGEVECIYVGAFEGYSVTPATPTALLSYANVAPTVSQTRAQFRLAAKASNAITTNPQYALMDYLAYNAIQMLYLVEFANFDSQTVLSAGITGLGATDLGSVAATGWTSANGPANCHELGNTSGEVVVHIGGTTYTDWAVSYRGLENIYGNMVQMLDGLNVSTGMAPWILYNCGLNITRTDAVTWTSAVPYQNMNITMSNASEYIVDPQTSGVPNWSSDWNFIPRAVAGGSASTYVCDWYQNSSDAWATVNMFTVGGSFNDGAGAGIFGVYPCHILNSDTYIGARLMLIPRDNTGFYIY